MRKLRVVKNYSDSIFTHYTVEEERPGLFCTYWEKIETIDRDAAQEHIDNRVAWLSKNRKLEEVLSTKNEVRFIQFRPPNDSDIKLAANSHSCKNSPYQYTAQVELAFIAGANYVLNFNKLKHEDK